MSRMSLCAGCLLIAAAIGVAARADANAEADPGSMQRSAAPGAPGEIAYVHSGSGNSEIYLVATTGGPRRNLTNHPAEDAAPAWSPDGSRLVFASTRSGSWDLFVLRLADGFVAQLTTGPASEFDPAWSPDGATIAYESTFGATREIKVVGQTGAGVRGVPSTTTGFSADPAWSSADDDLVFQSIRGGSFDLFQTTLAGDLSGVTAQPAEDFHPATSPDGSTIAFERATAGNYDLHLLDRATGGVRKLTGAKAEDAEPSWSPDGTRLAFTSTRPGDYDVYVLDLLTGQPVNVTRAPKSDDTSPVWRPVAGPQPALARATGAPVGALLARAASSSISCPTKGSYSGNYKANSIRGRNTSDTICGRGGKDVLKGGRGNDRLLGGAGRDDMYGQQGNDRLYGGVGEAGKGQDRMRGGAGNDRIYGRGDGARDCAAGNSGYDRARLDRGSTKRADNRGKAPWGASPCGDEASIEADE